MFLNPRVSGKILVYVYPPAVLLFLVAAGSFPNWGKYVVGERLCEFFSSSSLYPISIFIVIALFIASAVVLLKKPKIIQPNDNTETRRIRKEGRVANAMIIAVAESGQDKAEGYEDFEYVTLTLEVNDGVRKPYLVSVDRIVSYTEMASYDRGKVIEIKVDENNPGEIAFLPSGAN